MKNNIFLKSIAILIVCITLITSCVNIVDPDAPITEKINITYRFINNTQYTIESVLFGEIAPMDTAYFETSYDSTYKENIIPMERDPSDPKDIRFALWNWSLYSDDYKHFSSQSPAISVCYYNSQISLCNTIYYNENPNKYEGVLNHANYNYTFEKIHRYEYDYQKIYRYEYDYQFTYIFTEKDYLKASVVKRTVKQRVIKNQTHQVVKFYKVIPNEGTTPVELDCYFDEKNIIYILNPKDSLVENMAKIFNANTIRGADGILNDSENATAYAPTMLNLHNPTSTFWQVIIKYGVDKYKKLTFEPYEKKYEEGLLDIANYEYKKIDDYHYNYVYEITDDYFKDAESCN